MKKIGGICFKKRVQEAFSITKKRDSNKNPLETATYGMIN